jgi:hypothetical protein
MKYYCKKYVHVLKVVEEILEDYGTPKSPLNL